MGWVLKPDPSHWLQIWTWHAESETGSRAICWFWHTTHNQSQHSGLNRSSGLQHCCIQIEPHCIAAAPAHGPSPSVHPPALWHGPRPQRPQISGTYLFSKIRSSFPSWGLPKTGGMLYSGSCYDREYSNKGEHHWNGWRSLGISIRSKISCILIFSHQCFCVLTFVFKYGQEIRQISGITLKEMLFLKVVFKDIWFGKQLKDQAVLHTKHASEKYPVYGSSAAVCLYCLPMFRFHICIGWCS